MNQKFILISIVCLLCLSVSLFAGRKEELWQKAITEKDPNLKFQYLKEYEAEFGGKKDRFSKYLFMNLAEVSFKLQKWEDNIIYGEKTLEDPEIIPTEKVRIYMFLANAYRQTKKDLDKALHYAQKTIDTAREIIANYEKSPQTTAVNTDANAAQPPAENASQSTPQDEETRKRYIESFNTFYVAPALRLQSLIIYDKDRNNPEFLKQAAEKAMEAYTIAKTSTNAQTVASLGFSLYKMKENNAAIKALELVVNDENPEYNQVYLLANLFTRMKNWKKTVHYFELSHKVKPQADIAMKIATLVHKEDIQKGMRYYAEAYVLSGSDKNSEAYKYLQKLYFLDFAKDKTPEEKEAGFLELVNDARSRLGKTPAQSETPASTETTAEETTEESQG